PEIAPKRSFGSKLPEFQVFGIKVNRKGFSENAATHPGGGLLPASCADWPGTRSFGYAFGPIDAICLLRSWLASGFGCNFRVNGENRNSPVRPRGPG
ncbi:MAG: hypothetical protein ABEJ96_05620, partial [Thiohalorhabdaceae bacterium]